MNPLLLEGLADALGFVGGALVGFLLARLAGFDLFAEGYGASSMAAIVAVGIGAGLGRADGGVRDFLTGDRQVGRHRRRVDGTGDGTGDDDFFGLAHGVLRSG